MYSFSLYNKMAQTGIFMALDSMIEQSSALPVVLCVGSDKVIGDSLGPVCGSLLKRKLEGLPFFLYGDLKTPVTAKEIQSLRSLIKNTHPASKVIAVDAAVGEERDTGLIKLLKEPLKPGSGANKKLGNIGDISILGVIAEKSVFDLAVLQSTRMGVVMNMAETIAEGIATFLLKRYSERALIEKSAI